MHTLIHTTAAMHDMHWMWLNGQQCIEPRQTTNQRQTNKWTNRPMSYCWNSLCRQMAFKIVFKCRPKQIFMSPVKHPTSFEMQNEFLRLFNGITKSSKHFLDSLLSSLDFAQYFSLLECLNSKIKCSKHKVWHVIGPCEHFLGRALAPRRKRCNHHSSLIVILLTIATLIAQSQMNSSAGTAKDCLNYSGESNNRSSPLEKVYPVWTVFKLGAHGNLWAMPFRYAVFFCIMVSICSIDATTSVLKTSIDETTREESALFKLSQTLTQSKCHQSGHCSALNVTSDSAYATTAFANILAWSQTLWHSSSVQPVCMLVCVCVLRTMSFKFDNLIWTNRWNSFFASH